MVAQMAEEDVSQPFVPELLNSKCTLIVAEMAVSLAYTHFKFMWIWPGNEHIHVVVRFHDYRGRFRCMFYRFIGHSSQVCHYHELIFTCKNRISYCLGSIMRYHEVFYGETVDVIPLILDQVPSALTQIRGAERMGGEGGMELSGGIDRLLEALALGGQAADMVHMVMRHEHGTE